MGALILQAQAGCSSYFGFLNNLVTLANCLSLKEIGEMACVTPARSSRGQTTPILLGTNSVQTLVKFSVKYI